MKVLVVSHSSFSKIYNNGKTLASIFAGFPKQDLAQIYFTENMHPDFDFCNDYFKITDVDVLKSLMKGGADCGEILFPSEEYNINATNVSKGSRLFRMAKSRVDHLVLFRDLLWGFNVWKSKSLMNWIKSIRPDVVFYVGGNFGFSHDVAFFLSKTNQIPLVSYFTDDYLLYPKIKNLFDGIQRIRMKKFYKRTVNEAALRFAIGDVMSDEYSAFFGKKFYSLMNSISMEDYVSYQEGHGIIFSYFGGLHLNRWHMLLRLAHSLPKGSIDVYSTDQPNDEILSEFGKANINFKGAVEGLNLKNAILQSDVLLHVESDDAYNRTLTKLSISTKIPEYLMSGRMVLGFGPIEVASMRILSDNNIGVVISSSISKDSLKTELLKITSDFHLRKSMGLRGYKYAIDNFDNKVISDKFKNRILSLIKKS